jgi:hypothetical protein
MHCVAQELKSHGYTVVDGVISRELAAHVKAHLQALQRKGARRLQASRRKHTCGTDTANTQQLFHRVTGGAV